MKPHSLSTCSMFAALSFAALLSLAATATGCGAGDADGAASESALSPAQKTYASDGKWATISWSVNADDLTTNEVARVQHGAGRVTMTSAKVLPTDGAALRSSGTFDTKIQSTATISLPPELAAKAGSATLSISGEAMCFPSTTPAAHAAGVEDNVADCHIIGRTHGRDWTVRVAVDSRTHTTRVAASTTPLSPPADSTEGSGIRVETDFEAD